MPMFNSGTPESEPSEPDSHQATPLPPDCHSRSRPPWLGWYFDPTHTSDVDLLRERLVTTRDPEELSVVLNHLAMHGKRARRALSELKPLLDRSITKQLRMEAARVIAEVAPEESPLVLPILIAGLAEIDEPQWSSAACGLRSLGASASLAIPTLKHMLITGDVAKRVLSADVLVTIAVDEHGFVLPHLIELLQQGDAIYHSLVLSTLGAIGPSAIAAMPVVQQHVAGPNASEASIAIGRITGDWTPALEFGIRLFRDEDSLAGLVAQEHWMSLGPHAEDGIPLLQAEGARATESLRQRIQGTIEQLRNCGNEQSVQPTLQHATTISEMANSQIPVDS